MVLGLGDGAGGGEGGGVGDGGWGVLIGGTAWVARKVIGLYQLPGNVRVRKVGPGRLTWDHWLKGRTIKNQYEEV